MPFDDPRDFLACLEKEGDLIKISKEVNSQFEISAYIRKTSDQQGPALWFEKVKGYGIPVVGGLFAARRRILRALNYSPEKAFLGFCDGIGSPIPPVLSEQAPCNDVVLLGEKVDLLKLPIPTYCLQDGGAFITHGVQITRDPETGTRNAGIYRMQVKGRNRLGILAGPHQHCGIHFSKAEKRGEPLEIAVALGVDPAIMLATQVKASFGTDELALAGGLRDTPVKVAKCRTVDLEVPAWSEIVLEGNLLPDHREEEGPFGEFSGYYGPAAKRPVMEVTAITHRRSPIFHAGLTGVPMTENHFLKQLPNEATVYRDLKSKFPEVKAVHFPASGCSEYHCYISMTPRYKGQPRNVILAALGSGKRPKLVVVVDEDVDVYDEVKVLWAVSTRMQADRDVIVISAVAGGSLDPSTPELNLTAMMGIDATKPFGEAFAEVPLIPGMEKVPDLLALARRTG
jgi:4-hydroxy-3-polyprenylbenzoate decarboxylase/2,5-furandicarboxylate decarboxylase 1